jgi:hypothetical protein
MRGLRFGRLPAGLHSVPPGRLPIVSGAGESDVRLLPPKAEPRPLF